jgi:hypothetical protein
MRWTLAVLTVLILQSGLFAQPPAAASPEAIRADEQLVKAARVGVEGPALLAYLRKATPASVQREQLEALIKQLGSEKFAEREQASAALVALGQLAAPVLRRALKDPNVELARRAEKCLQQIDAGPTTSVTAAVARLVAVRRPEGAAEALLGYLP